MDLFNSTPKMWIENEEVCLKQLQEPTVLDKIPLLNANKLQNLKDGTLVRFRGMIQDMYSPEYYLEKAEIKNKKTNENSMKNAKFFDCIACDPDEEIILNSDKTITSERQTYVVISVPAINDWVKVLEEHKYKVPDVKLNVPLLTQNCKRPHEEMDAKEIGDTSQNCQASTSNTTEAQKKACINNRSQGNTSAQVVSNEHVLNFPLPERQGKACHIKIYSGSDELKLNDICEFIGFLATDPIVESLYQNDTDDDTSKMETETHHPPSSLVPRIHCVFFKKLEHNNPLVNEEKTMDFERLNYIRKELLLVLTQLLVGDALAAEYLLYHLISGVYLRRELMALGKLSLNISNVPILPNVDYVNELYKFIEMFVPKSYYLPVTLQNMNHLAFTPKKDYECNRLTSGILQLSSNTHLMLDETKLNPGKLNAEGLASVRAISNAIKNQKVAYNFNYYHIEYECDIPFLILSEGKSMFNTDCEVRLKPDEVCLETFKEIIEAARHFLKPELLNDIRMYLTVARLTKYDISDNVQSLVQDEFVNMRQRGAVTADDLHSLLVLARLVCISQGKSSLDEECWKKACGLEQERKAGLGK